MSSPTMKTDPEPPARQTATKPPSGATEFDPLGELLVAQESRPENIRPLNLRTLTPYHRALLVIDGTVTKFLEAFTMEPIEVERLRQEEVVTEAAHRWLAADAGSTVMVREVLISTRRERTVLAHAASLVAKDRIDPDLEDRLERTPGGLGRVLLGSQIETRREVLWYGRERATGIPTDLERRIGSDFITRTYRIIHDSRPLMMITERFPAAVDPTPAHH